jgi:hypothetical protein
MSVMPTTHSEPTIYSGEPHSLALLRVITQNVSWRPCLGLLDRFRRNRPASTLLEDRPLSAEEKAIAERLLRDAAPSEALAFLTQLDHARVTGRCSCGCPTVDLTVPAEFRVADPPQNRPLADATGRVDGKLVGVMLFQSGGLLSLLEVYRLEDVSDDPFGLPAVETIERMVWSDDSPKSEVK